MSLLLVLCKALSPYEKTMELEITLRCNQSRFPRPWLLYFVQGCFLPNTSSFLVLKYWLLLLFCLFPNLNLNEEETAIAKEMIIKAKITVF